MCFQLFEWYLNLKSSTWYSKRSTGIPLLITVDGDSAWILTSYYWLQKSTLNLCDRDHTFGIPHVISAISSIEFLSAWDAQHVAPMHAVTIQIPGNLANIPWEEFGSAKASVEFATELGIPIHVDKQAGSYNNYTFDESMLQRPPTEFSYILKKLCRILMKCSHC